MCWSQVALAFLTTASSVKSLVPVPAPGAHYKLSCKSRDAIIKHHLVTGASCGSATTQTIVCLPGTLKDATCEYAITGNISTASAQPCPDKQLFGHSCSTLPGLLIIAFGPCNEPLLQVLLLRLCQFLICSTATMSSQETAGFKPGGRAEPARRCEECHNVAGYTGATQCHQRGRLPSAPFQVYSARQTFNKI